MDPFVLNYQPDRYNLWMSGLDQTPHPEDPLCKPYPLSAAVRAQNKKGKALPKGKPDENTTARYRFITLEIGFVDSCHA